MRALIAQNRTLAALALAMTILGLVNVLAYQNAGRLVSEADEVARSYQMIIALRRVLAHSVDAESDQRGFVITGDERYLAPYAQTLAAIDRDIAQLGMLAGDPAQRERIARLDPLVRQRLDQLTQVITLRRLEGFAAAAELVNANSGKETQDRIRTLAAEIERAQLDLLDRRSAIAAASVRRTAALIALGSGLAFAGSLAAVLAVRQQADRALSASEQRFQRALVDAPFPVCIHAEGGDMLLVNRAWSEISGYDSAALPTISEWARVAYGSRQGEVRSRIDQLYALAGRVDEGEFVITTRSGQQRIWAFSSAPLGPGPDSRRQVISMAVDLTERKRAEEAGARYAGSLRDLSLRLVEVQESERRSIARELHDEIGQALTGLDLVIEMALRAPDTGMREHLRTAQGYVRDLTGRVRNLSLDLRPSMLDDLGLLPALRWLFQRYTEQTRIVVDFRSHQVERRFGSAIETAAYRIIQEALTNVARYANVPLVIVQLWGAPGHLMAQVEDMGAGFDLTAAQTAHRSSGLAGMRERAELLGGTLTIESAPGQGTIILLELPLDSSDKPERSTSAPQA